MNAPRSASSFEGRSADWLDVREARARVLEAASPLEHEERELEAVLGCALATEVKATATLPPWNNSAMDGYAVRAADVAGATEAHPVRLRVTGVVRAGGDADIELVAGTAVRIMTGAPVPSGADSIVRVEDTDAEVITGTVEIRSDRDQRRHIREAGQDMQRGDPLLLPGHTVTAGTVGVLAAAGRTRVTVHRAPVVALLSTGDELKTSEEYDEVRAGRGVPESNRPMLAAMAEAIGARVTDCGIAKDTEASLREGVALAADADVLVTIGGASMGEADLVKGVLDTLGYRQDFWRVRMRPGSPISFGWLPRAGRLQPVFGLPGNPSSAFVTFELFVRPFLLRLAGHQHVERRTIRCPAGERFDAPADLTYFQRVRITREGSAMTARLTGPQLSGLVRGLASADGLAVIPPEKATVEVGDPVDVILLDQGLSTPAVPAI